MAKQELPVDFKDDVLQAEMAGKRKYRIIQNEDGTISLEDVTNYSQIGSNFGAAQMNATNLAVNESFDKNKVIDSLADIVANEATGYAAGALAVRELNGNLFFKSGESIDLTGLVLDGYITQSGTRIVLSIPVGKKLDHIKTAKTNLVTGIVRQNGKYLLGTTENGHGFSSNQGTFLILKDVGVLRWQYDLSSAPDEVVNNDLVSVHFNSGTIKLN